MNFFNVNLTTNNVLIYGDKLIKNVNVTISLNGGSEEEIQTYLRQRIIVIADNNNKILWDYYEAYEHVRVKLKRHQKIFSEEKYGAEEARRRVERSHIENHLPWINIAKPLYSHL